MKLLILFCLEKDLINHFELTGVFPFIYDYMVTILPFFEILFFTFFKFLAHVIVMAP